MGGRVGDQSAPALKDLSFTIVPKQRLVENPGGNIFGTISGRNGLPFPRDPSQNYFSFFLTTILVSISRTILLR